MPKFYDPNQPEQYLKAPTLFGLFPIKKVVTVMQIIWLSLQIAFLSFVDLAPLLILANIVSIVFCAFVIAVFIVENKILMRAHYWSALVFIIVVIGVLLFGTTSILLNVSAGNFELKSLWYLIGGLIFFCALVIYASLCRKLIRALDQQPDNLPDLDTTQGLFHFNRDACDGSERVNLIYPEV
ncbi:hypothetical protein CRE_25289 [Caenorhabditis remanei]|uniref:MARVEL domain-containing protein n=1 Tax=Caenorhabditis remanei TaxID=31234 RepID=E3LSC4_CAERE|nr:hypothetical protein CRE_25289 [Caenorhabditis remanei]